MLRRLVWRVKRGFWNIIATNTMKVAQKIKCEKIKVALGVISTKALEHLNVITMVEFKLYLHEVEKWQLKTKNLLFLNTKVKKFLGIAPIAPTVETEEPKKKGRTKPKKK